MASMAVGRFSASLFAAATVSLKAVAINGVPIPPTNEITVEVGDTITAELRFSGWGHPLFDAGNGDTGLVRTYQVALFGLNGVQSSGPGHGLVLPAGWDAPLTRDIPPCDDPLYPFATSQYGCVGRNFHPELMASIDHLRPDYLLTDFYSIHAVANDSLDIKWGGASFDSDGQPDGQCVGGGSPGFPCAIAEDCPKGTCQSGDFYGGTLNLKAMPATAEKPAMCGTFTFNLDPGYSRTFIANPEAIPFKIVPVLQSLVIHGPACLPTGACCLTDGSCQDLLQTQCGSGIGVYHGQGTNCGGDPDSDLIVDSCDNCPTDYNPNQADIDLDLAGDACDNCPRRWNADQADHDEDGIGDVCDVCPYGPSSCRLKALPQ